MTLGLLAEFGREDTPVACDENRPSDAGEWPAEFLAGHERLVAGLPSPNVEPSELSAPELIAETVTSSSRPVVMWAVAPLTNVARAIEGHPEVAGGNRANSHHGWGSRRQWQHLFRRVGMELRNRPRGSGGCCLLGDTHHIGITRCDQRPTGSTRLRRNPQRSGNKPQRSHDLPRMSMTSPR